MSKLDELEALAKAATPGDYRACDCGKCGLVWCTTKEELLADLMPRNVKSSSDALPTPPTCEFGEHFPSASPEQASANAAFFAGASPGAVLKLIELARVGAELLERSSPIGVPADCRRRFEAAAAALEQA